MEKFSLEKYLKNTSRKVVTRDGRPVRIVCWDKLDDRPSAKEQKIVALVKEGYKENVFMYNNNGDGCISALDLFFADEEEELTEFEKEIINIVFKYKYWDSSKDKVKQGVKKDSKILLDLVKKEIEKSIEDGAIEFAKSYMDDVNPLFEKVQESEELWKWKMSCLKGINKAYTNGKQDALKDLPKWKKITEEEQNYLAYGYLSHDGYYLSIQELKDKLPKEE